MSKTLLQALGDVLREVRAERGLSQEELGLRTGVHRNYVGGIERGERSPTVVVVATLAEELDTSLHVLFERAESRLRASR
ncbi:MAG: helix-turn-helix transcriptional regulator [Thermoleophilaceae bacterium]